MKVTIFSGFQRSEWNRFFRSNGKIILFFFSYLSGLTVGSLFSGSAGDSFPLNTEAFFMNYFNGKMDCGFFSLFIPAAVSLLLYLGVVFLSGLFVFGMPICVLLPAFRGLSCGLVGGYLYSVFHFHGAAVYCALLLLPSFVSGVTCVYASAEAYTMCRKLSLIFTGNPPVMDYRSLLKRYSRYFCVFTACMLFSAALDALLFCLFSGWAFP